MPADKETFSLYSGSVKLEYTDKSHRYRASVDGGKPEHCPSVTTILNVLNKPALIPLAVKCACNYVEENLRKLVSGDTFSVQDVFKVIERARTAHDVAREDAAEIGTNVHDWLGYYWTYPSEYPALPDEARTKKCIEAALSWFKEHKLEPVAVEEPQYSRLHHFCGRPDWIGEIDGQLAVLDYKSTRSIYAEVSLQMAAYGLMHHEMAGEKPVARYALRLDKEDGSFEARKYTDNELDEDSFFACLKIYRRLAHLRRKPKPEPVQDFLAEL